MEITTATAAHLSNDILPGDLMLDIFLRLPVKALKRSSCVCKSWYSTFQNPNFITTYNCSVNRDLKLLICVEYQYRADIDYNSWLNHFRLCLFSRQTKRPIKLRLPSFFPRNNPPIICGCQGLICMSHELDLSRVALLNPTTREFKLLPPFDRVQPNGINYIKVDATGIGYDPITNDYKIIRFLFYNENKYLYSYDYNYVYRQWVELYSLNTNSWKEIPCPWIEINPTTILHENCNTYLNGCYHWLATEEDNMLGMYILVFDMSQETFLQSIKLPNCFNSRGEHSAPTIRLFNNNLAISTPSKDKNDGCFDIWVMEEYDNSDSWVKQIVIGPILAKCNLHDMWTQGEWPVTTRAGDVNNGKLRLYDQGKNVVKELFKFCKTCQEPCTHIRKLKFFPVTENLLRLNTI